MKNCRIALLVLVLIFSILGIFSSLAFADEVGITGLNIVSTTPANGAVNVGLNSKITVNFSKAIVKDNYPAIIIKAQDGSSYGYSLLDSKGKDLFAAENSAPVKSFIIQSPTFEPNTKYTVEMYWWKDGEIFNQYKFNFKTLSSDAVVPKVSSTSPANGAANVDLEPEIKVNFSADIYGMLDDDSRAASVVHTSIKSADGKEIDFRCNGPIDYDSMLMGKTLILKPYEGLIKPNTKYTVKIGTCYLDAQNNLIKPYTFSFTTKSASSLTFPTVVSTTPANRAVNVKLSQDAMKGMPDIVKSNGQRNLIIKVNFSEDVDYDNNSSYGVKVVDAKGNEVKVFEDFVGGRSLYISPRSNLLMNTKYTVKILKAFVDKNGKKNLPYSFSFTTAAKKVIGSTKSR